jgi:phytanoyl-CoA hydroxylase
VVAHCISSDAQFHPTNISYIYNRYKRHGDLAMDESFFPILWRKDGYRTGWLDAG